MEKQAYKSELCSPSTAHFKGALHKKTGEFDIKWLSTEGELQVFWKWDP